MMRIFDADAIWLEVTVRGDNGQPAPLDGAVVSAWAWRAGMARRDLVAQIADAPGGLVRVRLEPPTFVPGAYTLQVYVAMGGDGQVVLSETLEVERSG